MAVNAAKQRTLMKDAKTPVPKRVTAGAKIAELARTKVVDFVVAGLLSILGPGVMYLWVDRHGLESKNEMLEKAVDLKTKSIEDQKVAYEASLRAAKEQTTAAREQTTVLERKIEVLEAIIRATKEETTVIKMRLDFSDLKRTDLEKEIARQRKDAR